ncbi:imidazoleglycerol-phosphate dehydratase HisB [Asticcacaulis tiandongensis]|uniref:imidazoleglycerol-phosphate dehydratase HisB n=1 Tax=Asticcacaulis tiandongensis TaxID=2565365 RepID=UPI001129A137|nr:imidazoleglycerol-phosphate dehydratase HisB [Asticcacaulis tiandongensis]
MIPSPFSALNAASSGLESAPPSLEPLRNRMAEVYGVEPSRLVVTRDITGGLELILRRLKVNGFEGFTSVRADDTRKTVLETMAEAYGLSVKFSDTAPKGKTAGAYLIDNPRLPDGKAWTIEAARTLAVDIYPTLLVIDESAFDAADAQSLTALTATETNVVVLKSLSFLYGLAGAQVGALITSDKLAAGLQRFAEATPLATPSIRAAEASLSPSRALNLEDRIRLIRSEQTRLRKQLAQSTALSDFALNDGPWVWLQPVDKAATLGAIKRLGLKAQVAFDGLIVPVGDVAHNDRLLAAIGVVSQSKPARRGEVLRDTKETRISAIVDLDSPKPITIHTGNGFFDHMLDQVATHGGFSLQLACEGDLHIDAHHTIEDCMLAFGAALKQALGDRIGMARFGFVLPMDETEAKVSVDISGRAFCVFKGEFAASHIGEFPTEMTGHAFRSLADALGASVHVEVEGENDHHKVEACFKALGRALRMATRIEGTALPSTKGMLA